MIPLNLPKYNWIEYQQDVNFFKQLQNSLSSKCFIDTFCKDYFEINRDLSSLFQNLIKKWVSRKKLTRENRQFESVNSHDSER